MTKIKSMAQKRSPNLCQMIQIMEKLVKPGTNLRFIPNEEMFDVIHTVHIEKGHPGRDIMQSHMTQQKSLSLFLFNPYQSLRLIIPRGLIRDFQITT